MTVEVLDDASQVLSDLTSQTNFFLPAESAAKPRDGDCELRGDAEVEKGHFQSATKRFSQAVTAVQLELKNSSLTVAERQTKNRGLAVLFCKRASCQLMLQKLDAVVEDARNSIACDKGYYEVGKASLYLHLCCL